MNDMPEFLKVILTPERFIPHGHCYLWKPGLVWLHVISDSLISLAYYSIPFMLVYFVSKRRDMPFDWIFLMFGTFIVACGTTHLFEIWTLWYPTYWLSGLIKAITATASVSTAVLLLLLIPKALALPSPAQLEVTNLALRNEITQRQLAEEALQRANQELEFRVQERTAELALSNKSLQLEITNHKLTETQLKELLCEKELLLQEIHHRVKNNLQIISSLLDLQSQYVENKATEQMFLESQKRIKSMALVHEQLYQSKNFTKINFAEYLNNLTGYLFDSYGINTNKINLKLDIEDVPLDINTVITCGLIISELVSNSLKYAFAKKTGGTISIAFSSDFDKKNTLIVKDDGTGIPKNFDFNSVKSLGLQLVSLLANQLEATLELNCNVGTEVCLKFSEAAP
jgi:two-component sensor histidine kinase